jgi:predicted nucleotidyltransferase
VTLSEELIRINSMMNKKIRVQKDKIEDFCRRWKVVEFALFGSALREDFGPESDVDVLISFSGDADWDLFDWVKMIEELKQIFGREVDLVEKTALRNPFRRHGILSRREIIYAA